MGKIGRIGVGVTLVAGGGLAIADSPVGAVGPSGCTNPSNGGNWASHCYVGSGWDTQGGYVHGVQNVLGGQLLYTGCRDADFGSGTRSAVQAFQSNNGLAADGVVGASTWKVMQSKNVYQGSSGSGINTYYYSSGYGGIRFAKDNNWHSKMSSCYGGAGAWKVMEL